MYSNFFLEIMVQWMNPQPKPKPNDNKNSETIDDNDENGKLGYLSCAFFISLGLVFNKYTYEIFRSSSISQPMVTSDDSWKPIDFCPGGVQILIRVLELCLNFLIEIEGKIDETISKCEIHALVVIFMFGLMIILSAMLPKMSTDQCKKVGKLMGHHFISSAMVSFKRFCKILVKQNSTTAL